MALLDLIFDINPWWRKQFFIHHSQELIHKKLQKEISAAELGKFLEEHKVTIEPLDLDSVITASQAWMRYFKRKSKAKCPECGHKLNLKEHFLSDFYIGGYASAKCSAILTRDRGIYTKYFPKLVGYGDCLKETPS